MRLRDSVQILRERRGLVGMLYQQIHEQIRQRRARAPDRLLVVVGDVGLFDRRREPVGHYRIHLFIRGKRVEIGRDRFRPVRGDLRGQRVGQRFLLGVRTAVEDGADFPNLVLIARHVILTVFDILFRQRRDVVRQIYALRIVVLQVLFHHGLFFREQILQIKPLHTEVVHVVRGRTVQGVVNTEHGGAFREVVRGGLRRRQITVDSVPCEAQRRRRDERHRVALVDDIENVIVYALIAHVVDQRPGGGFKAIGVHVLRRIGDVRAEVIALVEFAADQIRNGGGAAETCQPEFHGAANLLFSDIAFQIV